jgi:hypothetical protein
VGIGTTNPSNALDVRPVGTGDAPNYGISHYFPATYSATVYANQLIASLRFKWYNDLWDIAGIRGGSSAWQSLAIRYNGTEFLTVGTGGSLGGAHTGAIGGAINAFSNNELINPLDSAIDVSSSVWHHFVVRVKNRAKFQSRLASLGVESDIHYPIAPFQSMSFRSYFPDQKLAEKHFPIATELAASVCSLPIDPWMQKHLGHIVEAVEKSL